MPRARKPSNYSLLFSYVLPYFLYVGALMLPLPKPGAYVLAILASALGLAWAWRWYVPLRGPRSLGGSLAAGVAGGVAGTLLWLVVKAPFYEAGGEPWTPAAFWMRLLASASVVPLFEELLFRGLLLRAAVQWDRARRAEARDPLGEALHERSVFEVEPGAWTPWALGISSVAFAAGHQFAEWPAALAYGLLMAGLWVVRKDLLTPVIAHGTTNLTLALWVRHTGQWSVW
jgi:membrane protease YdiL (CAAX protease family)